MSSEYILRFDTDEQAKVILKPLGFVIDSPTFGECWAINIMDRHILSNMFNGEGYWLKVTLLTNIDGFDEATQPYKRGV